MVSMIPIDEDGPPFDPDWLEPAERAILCSWRVTRPLNAELFGNIARQAVGFVRRGRAEGYDDQEIKDMYLGAAQDQAAWAGLPENRVARTPRPEFLAMLKAALRWGFEVTARDEPEAIPSSPAP